MKLKNVEKLSTIKPEKTEEQLLSESLSVVKEVREQLAMAYVDNKQSKSTIEKLTAEVNTLKEAHDKSGKTTEMLRNELDAFKARDAEVEQTTYIKRLEKLSASFGALGQEKTVEQLAKMPKNAISEFESITQLALTKKQQEKLSTLTVPTQSMPKRQPEKLDAVEKAPEKLKKELFEGVCKILTEQQEYTGNNSKRIIQL